LQSQPELRRHIEVAGQPQLTDARLTVRRVLELLILYPDRADLQREYPELEEEDIHQAVVYAAAVLDGTE